MIYIIYRYSVIIFILAWRSPCALAQVYFQTFWMKAYGSATPKRTIVYSNSAKIKMLDAGSMKKKDLATTVRTTTQYVAKDGTKRFAGNQNLKGTQFPSWIFRTWCT